ncbi:N-acetyltransferase B complex non catalytic subunit protein [Rutstroemia sp. NJR-2017a BBW]|nr:N-acetyltransferase B complex non catalytic subunit protein [Rutstroemia sp. NJR-2017a BBW]PQE08579.1 N-acetyltransferase B complex non catalytic subunit protein [Rutstroemia sp. NJR-2017a BBW]
MADQLLKDRQDAPIWNAIEASNFKQALKLVDKRLAKKRTPHLEAFKIYIRSRSTLQSEKDAVLAHIEDLATKKVAVTDLDDIDLYDDALEAVMPDAGELWVRTIGELRWQAVKTLPKQEELGLKSFKACLSENDLEHAQQTRRGHTNPVQISQDLPVEKRSLWGRLALGQISKLAAATTQVDVCSLNPSDYQSSDLTIKTLPVRSIQAPQELLLLQRIAGTHGKLEDQLKYLNEPSLGPESTIAKGDWELWRNKLQLMEKSEQWQEIFEATGQLLKRARTKNENGQIIEARLADWVVWQAYLNSATTLEKSSALEDVASEIAAHLDPGSGIDKTWRRNASLAWLTYTFKATSSAFAPDVSSTSEVEKNPRITAVVKYLQNFGDATTVYDDLKPYVEQLEPEERRILLDVLRNGVKFEDAKSKNDLDIPEHERRSNPLHKTGEKSFICKYCSNPCEIYCDVCLEQVAKDAVAAYSSAINDDGRISAGLLPTDRHPADDFCTLAAMALMKLSISSSDTAGETIKTRRTAYILQATLLLDYAWSKSKSNSDFSLLLVRLYASLGCGSQAMKAYLHLNLKQIQLDTLGYMLLDRISSLHPHPFPSAPDGSSENYSPIEHLKRHQKMYRNIRGQVAQNTWKAFEHGSYDTIFQFKEFSDIMSSGMMAISSFAKTKRIVRLIKPTTYTNDSYKVLRKFPCVALPPYTDSLLAKNPELMENFSDTSDYASFPDYDSNLGVRLEKLTRFAPGPSASRSRMSLLTEKIISIIESDTKSKDTASLTSIKETYLPKLQALLEQEKAAQEATLTRPEHLTLEAFIHLAEIIVKTSTSSEPEPTLAISNASLRAKLEQVQKLVNGCQHPTPASFDVLHTLYNAYDLASNVERAVRYLGQAHLKVAKAQIEENKKIGESAVKAKQAVEEKVKSIKDGLDESGWIDSVVEVLEVGGLGDQLRGMVGDNFVEEWAGEVVESWRESVVGLGYLKV